MKQVILVIDDDPLDRLITQKILEATQFVREVIAVNSGKEALDYLQSARQNKQSMPDHFFVDINMPGMNGFEFVDQLQETLDKASIEQIKIHLLTSSILQTDKDRAIKNEIIQTYVIKPFTVEKSIELLQN